MLLFVFSLRFRASTYTINIIMFAYIYKEREKPYLKLRVPALSADYHHDYYYYSLIMGIYHVWPQLGVKEEEKIVNIFVKSGF